MSETFQETVVHKKGSEHQHQHQHQHTGHWQSSECDLVDQLGACDDARCFLYAESTGPTQPPIHLLQSPMRLNSHNKSTDGLQTFPEAKRYPGDWV
jgi:hypothetical protein